MQVTIDPKIENFLRAIVNQRRLSISYTKSNGEFSKRDIIPLDFVKSDNTGQWRVYGYCPLRNDFRTFRSDRISDISLTANENQDKYKTFRKGDDRTLLVSIKDSDSVICAKYNGTNLNGDLFNSHDKKPASVITKAEAESIVSDLISQGFSE